MDSGSTLSIIDKNKSILHSHTSLSPDMNVRERRHIGPRGSTLSIKSATTYGRFIIYIVSVVKYVSATNPL
jgi:hypothetical protein